MRASLGSEFTPNRDAGCDLLLVFVSYHTSVDEVNSLRSCLLNLPSNIRYAVVVNDYILNEPIDALQKDAAYFIKSSTNLGYGKAINKLIFGLKSLPEFIGIMNTDLYWDTSTFPFILKWMTSNKHVSLLVPRILNKDGQTQFLCKQNPTILGMVSRRFIPTFIKPRFLKLYDSWYTMRDYDYNSIFDVPYLSGCCMVARSSCFVDCGGFDDSYFLYLEDADLTRLMSSKGKCIHFPFASVTHRWGRGNYLSFRLMLVNVISAWHYFSKWGLKVW
tara:strand:- start:454 stop:1278 length:825 start_codon:yes stop_codon:yes gene_type:complete